MTSYRRSIKSPRQRQRTRRKIMKLALLGLAIFTLFNTIRNRSSHRKMENSYDDGTYFETGAGYNSKYEGIRPELNVDLLDINSYSRPGTALEEVNGVVVHYTANPGSSAKANRDYFNDLQNTHITKASSHFIVGLEGEIVQCVPCKEVAYASNSRNSDTISIECCIEDDTGKFNKKTYSSVVELVGWLVLRYDLEVDDVIRHYDVTGKNCPKYFVENPDEWDNFKDDVAKWVKKNK